MIKGILRLTIAGLVMLILTALVFAYFRNENNQIKSPSSQNSQFDDQYFKDISTKISSISPQTEETQDLQEFALWLSNNKARGYIGEFGWPYNEAGKWQSIAEEWLELAKTADLSIGAWAAGANWPADYRLQLYRDNLPPNGLDSTTEASSIFTNYSNDTRFFSVNMSGLEFGTSNWDFSNRNPGNQGLDYFLEPKQSFDFLANQNISYIRLPISWERIQPSIFGELNSNYAELIEATLNNANDSGIKVILDLHNYGEYRDDVNKYYIGSQQLPHSALVDVWLKLNRRFASHPAIYAYDIMNEPRDTPGSDDGLSPVKNWEQATQNVLDALRADNFAGVIMIPGYDWSSLARWINNHPEAWIEDPINNFMYTAHHYWDEGSRGSYVNQ